MKRILIFSTAYAPLVGGAEIAIQEITNRLGSEYHFDLLTARMNPAFPHSEQVGAVTVYRIGIGMPLFDKLLAPWAGAFYALYLGTKHRYDLYWVVMASFMGGAAYIANLVRFWHQIPIVLTLQEGDSQQHIKTRWGGLVGLSWRLALMRTHTLTVLSNYLESQAREFGFRGEIHIVPNGVDVKHFSKAYTEEEKHTLRKKLNLDERCIYLITTSRLVTKNAVDDVIKALPLLDPTIHFLILGSGKDETMLRLLAEEKSVSERVHFLGDVSHEQLPLYLSISRIFIRPSRSEGMGNSFIEAMAAKLPVIATQEGGIADFLFDRKRNPNVPSTGWAVDPNAPEHITAAVQEILTHPEEVQKTTTQAWSMVAKKYDWDTVAGQMRGVFTGM